MKIRQTTMKDFEEIHYLTAYCYGFDAEGSKERGRKRFELTFDENFCVEVDGKIVANTRMIPFEQFVRGKRLKMAGIAMIVTQPLARRKGYIRESMNYLLEKMYKDDYAVTALYPFKDTFYARYGYVNAPPLVRMRINPRSFSRWKSLPEGYTIERVAHDEGFKHLQDMHNKVIPKINGGVLRSEKRWKEYDNSGPAWYLIVYNPKNEVEAAIKFSQKGFMIDFEWSEEGKLTIHEQYILTEKARAAFYNYLFLHSDQINQVQIPIDNTNSTLYPWLQGYYITKLAPKNIWMARIVNIESTIKGMDAEKEGSIKIKITDEQIKENNQTFELSSEKGKLKVKALGEVEADVEMHIKGITALVYGLLSAVDIELFDWMKNASDEKRELLNVWFPILDAHLTEGF